MSPHDRDEVAVVNLLAEHPVLLDEPQQLVDVTSRLVSSSTRSSLIVAVQLFAAE